jgi:hypothetical protein
VGDELAQKWSAPVTSCQSIYRLAQLAHWRKPIFHRHLRHFAFSTGANWRKLAQQQRTGAQPNAYLLFN